MLIGALMVLLANSVSVAAIQRALKRRARAADLYSEYYSADNYRRIVLPVIRLQLK